MRTISEIINYYKPILIEAGKAPIDPNYSQLNDNFMAEIKKIVNPEAEILSYLKKSISSGEWEDESYWIPAAIVHPSESFLEYYLKAIKVDNINYPHWRILDALAYMPEAINSKIKKGIKEAIKLNNLSWREEDLKKAFEILVWIGDEEDIKFIENTCNSSIKRVAQMAEYWVEWLKEDDEEDD